MVFEMVLQNIIFQYVNLISRSFKRSYLKWQKVVQTPHTLASYGYFQLLKVCLDNMKIEDSLCFNLKPLEGAISCGNLEMFEYLLDHYRVEQRLSIINISKTILFDLLAHAAKYGRIDIAMLLFKRFSEHRWIVRGALIKAPKSGDFKLFKFLLEQYDRHEKAPAYAKVFDSVAKYGRLEMLEWLFSQYPDGHNGSNMFVYAIENGHTHIVEYLLENHRYLFQPKKEHYLKAAASSKSIGALDLFIRLYRLGCQCSINVIDTAAASGNLEIIKWIHSNTTIPFHRSTMNTAGRLSQFEVLKWLHENRTEGCSENLIDLVVIKNDLQLIKYLHHNRSGSCTVKAMNRSLKLGHLQTAIWLYENRTERFTPGIIKKVVLNGELNSIRWLEENTEERCTDYSLEVSVKLGFLDVVKYLHERNGSNNRYSFSTKTMDLAIRGDYLNIVEWLNENRTECCSETAITDALQYCLDGSAVIRWLFVNQTKSTIPSTDVEKLVKFLITLNRHRNLHWLLENIDVSVEQLIQYQNSIGKGTSFESNEIIKYHIAKKI
ncbi:hypothetical protein PPL_04578 [Heterostelium album PN500]|uniref:Ankyrin repeat-containing protein n=1 Tax=Heterostelium pallidum (strain ATCC 26659 / Pp 5 / PN500) TaxID=670386 RepID=D3B7Z0_HETP5|nr:hypothetical protein PPL_04578 [Heterostelium album PN500]EFA82158.1 hypothetical protein PPL_04578 [Heterostelium album PN500]|eukprot:XP_020434275.1 hypothetical protein PPL_04578 [Heterostelium album PN500]